MSERHRGEKKTAHRRMEVLYMNDRTRKKRGSQSNSSRGKIGQKVFAIKKKNGIKWELYTHYPSNLLYFSHKT